MNSIEQYLSCHRKSDPGLLKLARSLNYFELESATDSRIVKIRNMVRQVSFEIHRLKAFVRLSELGEKTLVGKVEPEHRIISFILRHFCFRFPGHTIVLGNERECWKGIMVDRKITMAQMSSNEASLVLAAAEQKLKDNQLLWKDYYRSQYAESRDNPKLFSKAMPKKLRRAAGSIVESGFCTDLNDFFE